MKKILLALAFTTMPMVCYAGIYDFDILPGPSTDTVKIIPKNSKTFSISYLEAEFTAYKSSATQNKDSHEFEVNSATATIGSINQILLTETDPVLLSELNSLLEKKSKTVAENKKALKGEDENLAEINSVLEKISALKAEPAP